MSIKRNLIISLLVVLFGLPLLSTIHTNVSANVPFGNAPAVSNPSKFHVTERSKQGITFRVAGDPQPQMANYGSPLEKQLDGSSHNTNQASNSSSSRTSANVAKSLNKSKTSNTNNSNKIKKSNNNKAKYHDKKHSNKSTNRNSSVKNKSSKKHSHHFGLIAGIVIVVLIIAGILIKVFTIGKHRH